MEFSELEDVASESTQGTSQVIMATASYDHTIRFWDVIQAKVIRTLQHNESQVNAMCIAKDKSMLVVAGNPKIKIFEALGSKGIPVRVYSGHEGNVLSLSLQNENNWLLSSGEDGTLRVWDLRTSKCQKKIDNDKTVAIRGGKTPFGSACLFPNQREAFTSDLDGRVRIWDLGEGKCSKEIIVAS